jgi:putative hydrolase of HD superfamily
MDKALDFLLEVSKLKTMQRTGWVLRKVKNPETIADHTFRLALACWLLAEKRGINSTKAVKMALAHDLCEVYAGDMTPFFYYVDLPQGANRMGKEEALKRWVRLTKKEKEERGKIKLQKEKEGLEKLIKSLSPKLRRELFSSWLDYERGMSQEGKFVRQVDKIETLLQSIEYFGNKEEDSGTGWWEGTEETVEDPLLIDFLKVIQARFYPRDGKAYKNEDLENILDFLLQVGKLKGLPRMYWKMRKIKGPETVAGHIFSVSIMAWVFGSQLNCNLGRLIKMALCHEISAVYTGDTTPYDSNLPEEEGARKEVLKKWVRLSQEEKAEQFAENFKEEKEALENLSRNLKPPFKEEIIELWKEYRTRSSLEGNLLSQINVLAVLLQNLLYEREDKKFFSAPIWEWAFEKCDNQLCFDFFDEAKKRFYPRGNQ